MIPLGLSATDQATFERGLLHDHEVSTTVRVLDMDHNVVGVVSDGVISGQVDVDSSQEVERSCSVEIVDRGNRLGLAAAGPMSPAVTLNRMVQVVYNVKITGLPWIHIPLFTGPITKADEHGGQVSVTAQGKESLLNEPTAISKTLTAGTVKSTAIRQYLAAMGETHTQFSAFPAVMAADQKISGVEKPWPILTQIARGIIADSSNYPYFGYDGNGICKLSSHSDAVKWVFDGSSLASTPKITTDETEVKNWVRVVNNNAVLATKMAPVDSMFSPAALGRGGVPRYLMEDVSTDSTDKTAAAKLAASTLDQKLRASVSLEFESLIVPHLEPRDVIQVVTDKWTWALQVTKWTIPLGASQAMSHGRNSQIRPVGKYAAKGKTR